MAKYIVKALSPMGDSYLTHPNGYSLSPEGATTHLPSEAAVFPGSRAALAAMICFRSAKGRSPEGYYVERLKAVAIREAAWNKLLASCLVETVEVVVQAH